MTITTTNSKELIIPAVVMREVVIFPHMEVVLSFGKPESIRSIHESFNSKKLIFIVTQKDSKVNNPTNEDLNSVGTVCQVERVLKTGDDINALVKGLFRAKIIKSDLDNEFHVVKVSELEEFDSNPTNSKATANQISANLRTIINLGKTMDFLVFMKLMSGVDNSEMADQVAAILDQPMNIRQDLLETLDINKRLQKVNTLIAKELKIFEIEKSISNKAQKKFDNSMREAVLREKMKTIQKELGEVNKTMDTDDPDIKEFKKKLKLSKMPDEIKQKVNKEMIRLSKMHSYNPEAGYIRSYLEVILDLPWGKLSKNNVKNKKAEKVLNEDHYGLKKVKERIIEYLSVMSLKKEQYDLLPSKAKKINSTTILCFSGPPGVGKTSIGKSIAKALGRKFVKISVGGIRDEAEIRGHRRTYVGSMPGRIIQGIKEAGTINPVFMLDEIDKIGSDFRGDPSSALLEALDPEQNDGFTDHYIDAPFDLSNVLFITTANVLDTIPHALRDRLEIIRFSGYTYEEKFMIAKKYLLEKTTFSAGMLKKQVHITDTAIKQIIRHYTREAGVRNLERELNKIMRKIARKINEKTETKVSISSKNLHEYLGPVKFLDTLAEKKDEVGMSTGLAWTSVGGEILFIEVATMPGKGDLTLTGQLGDVMKESCRAALTYIRSHWKELGLKKDLAAELDFHIHVPEGATPKDGPSAGGAIATALYSAMSKKKVHKDVGMTGEITLRGRILEIGGLKEKLIAAYTAGLKTVIIPKYNKKDLVEVPKKVRDGLNIKFADNLNDILKIAIVK